MIGEKRKTSEMSVDLCGFSKLVTSAPDINSFGVNGISTVLGKCSVKGWDAFYRFPKIELLHSHSHMTMNIYSVIVNCCLF